MGGSALLIKTRRYNKNEYNVLKEIIETTWSTKLKTKVKVVKSYSSKESFGDIDVLVEIVGDRQNMINKIKSNLIFDEIVINGNIISINQNDFQVDLILTPANEFYIAEVFFSFNDLSIMIGRLAKSRNLTFGSDGLFIEVYINKNKIGKFLLTKDPMKIFNILGLDYHRYLKGFDTIIDVFEFVASSIYFDSAIFEPKNENSENRRRDKKRKNYMMFQEWLKTKSSINLKKPSMYDTIEEMNTLFPDLLSKILEECKRVILNKFVNNIFSGTDAMYLTDLKGSEFGKIFGDFKKNFKDVNLYNLCVLLNGKVNMQKMFKKYIE